GSRAPNLFPLVSCGTPATQDLYSVGCVAVGFIPNDLTFGWSTDTKENITKGVKVFPSVLTAGRYTASSHLSLPLSDGKTQQPFYCRATHPKGSHSIEVSNPGPNSVTSAITIHPPSREDFEGPYRNSSVLCQIRGPRQLPAAVRWLKNGVLLKDGVTTESSVADSKRAYITNSWATVTEAEWDAGTVFTCQVDEDVRNTSKALECGYDHGNNNEEITVQVVPPVFADIFKDKVAKLTCKVTNLPGVEGLVISWWKENGGKLDTKTLSQVLQPNGFFSVDGIATVYADEWDKGEIYTCKVSHPELLFPAEVKLQKTPSKSEGVGLGEASAAPSIYIFSPPSEQLTMQESATITCLVKGFNPPDLFVRWLRNGEPLPTGDYITMPPVAESQPAVSYFTYSSLTVSGEDWRAGNIFTCLVGHEQIPLQVAQKSVDKASAFLDGFTEAEEDDLNNLWATASTFIILFILSLFYSATVTLIKVP
ncbi:IGHM protein, partial [Circaetus pectoralis]|nr:IGHM protein [Circaetus pectoralis]